MGPVPAQISEIFGIILIRKTMGPVPAQISEIFGISEMHSWKWSAVEFL